jgi:hypothetical protein
VTRKSTIWKAYANLGAGVDGELGVVEVCNVELDEAVVSKFLIGHLRSSLVVEAQHATQALVAPN